MLPRFVLLLALGACGRLGFEGIEATGDGRGSSSPDGNGSGSNDAATRANYVSSIVVSPPMGLSSYGFTATATNPGDLVVFQIACNGAPGPSMLVSPTWTVTGVGQRSSSPVREVGVDSFAAIAPDTATASFTATFNSGCILTIYGAEFSNVAGGSLASIDAVENLFGTCNGSVTTTNANDTIWEACSGGADGNPTPGYTLSGGGEYRVTSDPDGTVEMPTLGGGSVSLMTVMAIAPQ